MSEAGPGRRNAVASIPDTTGLRPLRYSRPAVDAEPATPRALHRHGDLSASTVDELSTVAAALWQTSDSAHYNRTAGLRRMHRYLDAYPGSTWQQRWDASPLATGMVAAAEAVAVDAVTRGARDEVASAVKALFALRVVRPSVAAFKRNKFLNFAHYFLVAESDADLARFVAAVGESELAGHFTRAAIYDVCAALTTQGIPFADLTASALMHFASEVRQTTTRSGLHTNKYAGHLAWQVMHSMGHFPTATPPTLRAALRSPQLTIVEMVDRHPIADGAVRQLFIDYLERRSVQLEYVSLSAQADIIVRVFWRAVVELNPNQSTLQLSDEVYQQWRTGLRTAKNGTARSDQSAVLMWVRALYFDIQAWAVHEPERWAQWVAPCPISNSERRTVGKHKRRVRERTHDTVRRLQPLLPVLIEHIDERAEHWRTLLALATTAADRGQFIHNGVQYTRVHTKGDKTLIRTGHPPNVRVTTPAAPRSIDVKVQEDAAFWTWAIVRHCA